MDHALAALLHLLVFGYWLGGDVGAFVASFVLTDERQSPAARLTAAKILSHVDMAPRSALVLTLPTGLSLADARGWLAIDPWLQALAWVGAVAWLALLWWQHVAHSAAVGRIDFLIRVLFVAGLAAGALFAEPPFLQAKLGLLALAVCAGLAIRRIIGPMGPALAQLSSGEPTPANGAIAASLNRARPLVVLIWLMLIAAAWLGVAKPA
jgi:hypothetical protein